MINNPYVKNTTCPMLDPLQQKAGTKARIEYDSKYKNLSVGDTFGKYTKEAIKLTYDRLINTSALKLDPSSFPFNSFEPNLMWWLDATIGIESNWDKTRENRSSTAYGWAQFKMNLDSDKSAAIGYRNLIKDWNTLSIHRSWIPTDDTSPIDIAVMRASKELDIQPENLLAVLVSGAAPIINLIKGAKTAYMLGKTPAERTSSIQKLLLDDFKQYGSKSGKVITSSMIALGNSPLVGIAIRATKLLSVLNVTNLSSSEPGLDEWLEALEQNSALIHEPDWVTMLINFTGSITQKKAIIDKLSLDQIGALMIVHAGQGKGSDVNGFVGMTSNDPQTLSKSGKLLYLYGHMRQTASLSVTKVQERAAVDARMGIFFGCVQPTAASFSAGVITANDMPICSNKVYFDEDDQLIHDTIDHIFNSLTIKSAEDYIVAMTATGSFTAHDVTDHFPSSVKDIIDPTVNITSGIIQSNKVYRLYTPKFKLFTQYIGHIDDTDEAVLSLKRTMFKRIKSSANPKELLRSTKISFSGKHSLYMLGFHVFSSQEKMSIASVLIKDSYKSVINGKPVVIGDVELFPWRYKQSGTSGYSQFDMIYYKHDIDNLKDQYSYSNTLTAFSGESIDGVVSSKQFNSIIDTWLDDEDLKNKFNLGLGDVLIDQINDGKLTGNVLNGAWINATDSTTLSLIDLDPTNTLYHEIGGHRDHNASWGVGDRVLWTESEVLDMRVKVKDAKTNSLQRLYDEYKAINVVDRVSYDKSKAALIKLNTTQAMLNDKIGTELMSWTAAIYDTSANKAEDELLARLYAIMALNGCVSFKHDIYPRMQIMGVSMRNDVIEKVDVLMKEEMGLDLRTYK
jgi:hypothetical protein